VLTKPIVVVSFDCFGTLVDATRPEEPAVAIAQELRARGVDVPADWPEAYRERQLDPPAGAETPLPVHVSAALASRDIDADEDAIRRAVVAALDPDVETRDGALEAVEAAAEYGPVAICSNCSVSQLVWRSLERSAIAPDTFDAIVTSVDCGWRKPDRRIFEMTATRLDATLSTLVHVGDDPHADGGIEDYGGRCVLLTETELPAVPERLEEAHAE
jgi:FMN phosphatase YigB (HAD superfamily)